MLNAFARKLKAYAPLTEDEVRLLVTATSFSKKVGARRDLIREGDKPGAVLVVLEGWAYRYKMLPEGSRQNMAFMMPGDFCDPHVGSLEEMDHSVATATACKIAFIPRAQMEALIVASPSLTHAFWRAQLIDQGVSRAWIVSMGRRSASERVAHLMLELYVRMQNIGLVAGGSCEIPLSQILVSDALGLTPVHVNRVFRSFRESALMTLASGRLVINDISQMTRIAGFDDNYLHRRIVRDL